MEKTLPLEERSINDIYMDTRETKTYMIPVYQRNYAWEEDEITALIEDVYDSSKKISQTPYYIGTLVTYKRGDSVYEVIDGQQRLTTIYIILNALGIKDIKSKLTYGARSISASTIDKLKDYPNLGEEVDKGIMNGYKYAKKAIEDIGSGRERERFKKYFLDEVRLIHYSVPKDVNLNHYFEVMNSRGEQLEKHEIVKSKLSQCLNSKKETAIFSRVWEACSEMNTYIQQAFENKIVFGNSLDTFQIESFSDIPEQDESEGKETIKSLFLQTADRIDEINASEQNDKFQPIIDFPNFLLIVLKTTMKEYEAFEPTEFTLDDKELLNEFDKVLFFVDDKAEFVRGFAFNLLKARYYLDNYIVHHSLNDKELLGDNPWKLQYYHYEKKKGYPVNLVEQKEQDVQDELVHLLSMFEVTFTPKQRKNYLFYCLVFLFENEEPSGREYLKFLQSLADKYFYDVYLNTECLNERNQPGPNSFDNVIMANGELNLDEIGDKDINYEEVFEEIYEQGRSDIPLFVFNYTDYILWKKYAETIRSNKTKKGSTERQAFFNELGCSDFELEFFKNFYFSRTRKSLEHFYPQAKVVVDKSPSENDINCFGNFAMIGSEANSSGSNWDPKAKLYHYSDGKSDQVSVASLKFKIMMQMCQDNIRAIDNGILKRDAGMEWDAKDMQTHQKKMLNIIIK